MCVLKHLLSNKMRMSKLRIFLYEVNMTQSERKNIYFFNNRMKPLIKPNETSKSFYFNKNSLRL